MNKWKNEYDNYLLKRPFDFENAQRLKNLYIPLHLYKYRSFDKNNYWKSWINGDMFLSSPIDFNDPFDCILSFSQNAMKADCVKRGCLKAIEKFITLNRVDINRINFAENALEASFTVLEQHGYKIDKRLMNNDILESSIDSLRRIMRLICFSERNDSILMWSHYSENHTGFCIEYDFSNDNYMKEFLFPVVYSKLRNECSNFLIDHNKKWSAVEALCKAPEWGYEKEWRFLGVDRIGPNVKYYINVAPSIKAIYLGANIAEENLTELKNELGGRIPLYQMALSKKEYILIPNLI